MEQDWQRKVTKDAHAAICCNVVTPLNCRCFKTFDVCVVFYKEKKTEAMLIVGPKCAISVVTNIKNNTVSTKIGNYIVYICNFCTNLHNLSGLLNMF